MHHVFFTSATLYLRNVDELFPFQHGGFSCSAGRTLAPPDTIPLPIARGAGGCVGVNLLPSYDYTVSVIVVSFNTRDLLRECIQSILTERERLPPGLSAEILVVDNASSDGSPEMVA